MPKHLSSNQEADLSAILSSQQRNSSSQYNSSLSKQRAELTKYYYAEKYGDEVADRSQYVDAMCRDTVESVKPEILDIFYGGDKVVEFAPRGPEDEDKAKQETEVVNYIINEANPGFKVVYDWVHDALAFKNGYVKVFWEEHEETAIEEFGDLSLEDGLRIFADLSANDDVSAWEIIEGEEDFEEAAKAAIEGAAKAAVEEEEVMPVSLDIKLKIDRKKNRYRIISVPPEEIYVHPEWTDLDFDTDSCPFVAHRAVRTRSDLIAEGFDREQVEKLPKHDIKIDKLETLERFNEERATETDVDSLIGTSMEEVLVYENYLRYDLDGDGISELLQIYSGRDGNILRKGGQMAIVHVDHVPIVALCPLPIPHKHYGLALSELVADLARLKSIMTRQLVDNLVLSNNADIYLDENAVTENTDNDLRQTRPGRVIRGRGPAAITYLPAPNTAAESLRAIEYMDSLRESRTGVTRYNQGLDADSLNKTATGIRDIMTAAQKRILMIARVFAETGFRTLFQKIHQDLRKGPMKKIALKLRNEWVEVNPRTWVDRTDLTINVGLGTGNRDVQFSRLLLVLEQQKEALAIDPTGQYAGVTMRNIHHTLTNIMRISGFHDVQAFFPEPVEGAQPPAPPPAPDPAEALVAVEQIKGQNQLSVEQLRAQTKLMERQLGFEAEAQLKEVEMRNANVRAAAQMQYDLETKEAETEQKSRAEELDYDIKLRGQDLTALMKQQDIETKAELEKMNLALTAQIEALKLEVQTISLQNNDGSVPPDIEDALQEAAEEVEELLAREIPADEGDRP